MNRLAVLLLALAACGGEPPRERPVEGPAPAGDAELEAARVLLRHQKARIDGIMPPATWPEPHDVRRVSNAFVTDIDTAKLPGGYPQQLVVETFGAGGHSGRPVR
jgi:hypothetical protein